MTTLLERSPELVVPYASILQQDIRVGTVLAASRVPHSKKLIVLEVDVGETKPRCIVTGSKPPLSPKLFFGKQVPIVCNVPPRELTGLMSQGVLLSTYDALAGRCCSWLRDGCRLQRRFGSGKTPLERRAPGVGEVRM